MIDHRKQADTATSGCCFPVKWDSLRKRPVHRPPRVKARMTCGIAVAFAMLFFFLGHPSPSAVILVIAATLFLCAHLRPNLYTAVERVLQHCGYGVGWFFTWLLLPPFFFLCFGAGRLWLLLRKRDPLHRSLIPEADTYWEEKPSAQVPVSRYRRQF